MLSTSQRTALAILSARSRKVTTFERRYHATWSLAHGFSPLAKLGRWMTEHRAQLQAAPRDLLVAAAADVADRLPRIAAREPTRRHRKHFAWLLGWHMHLVRAIGGAA